MSNNGSLVYRYWRLCSFSLFDENTNSDTLSNVEDVFVFRAVWCALLLLAIPVQIQNVYVIKCF
jgi:hypothetical protein